MLHYSDHLMSFTFEKRILELNFNSFKAHNPIKAQDGKCLFEIRLNEKSAYTEVSVPNLNSNLEWKVLFCLTNESKQRIMLPDFMGLHINEGFVFDLFKQLAIQHQLAHKSPVAKRIELWA